MPELNHTNQQVLSHLHTIEEVVGAIDAATARATADGGYMGDSGDEVDADEVDWGADCWATVKVDSNDMAPGGTLRGTVKTWHVVVGSGGPHVEIVGQPDPTEPGEALIDVAWVRAGSWGGVTDLQPSDLAALEGRGSEPGRPREIVEALTAWLAAALFERGIVNVHELVPEPQTGFGF